MHLSHACGSTSLWYGRFELEGAEIKWYKSPPSGDRLSLVGGGQGGRTSHSEDGVIVEGSDTHTRMSLPIPASPVASTTRASTIGVPTTSMDQELGTMVITRETTVDCNTKEGVMYVSTGSQSAWLIADTGPVAAVWAEAIRKTVRLYGESTPTPVAHGNADTSVPSTLEPTSPVQRRAAAPLPPRVIPRMSTMHERKPSRPLTMYAVFDEAEDDTVNIVGRAKVGYHVITMA